MAKGSGSGGTQLYYGCVWGVFCNGPVDELVAIVIDGGTVWPSAQSWNNDIISVPIVSAERVTNIVTFRTGVPHGLKHGQSFEVAGVGGGFNGTFTIADAGVFVGGSTTFLGDQYIKVHQVAADGSVYNAGTLSKVTHYALDAIVRYQAGMWICVLAHDATAATAPPNPTYWDNYSLKRSVTNPVMLTIPGYGRANFYWGTSTQNLSSAGTAAFINNGHPPYRQQCGIELIDFLFGTERQGPPNIQAIVVRKPVQTVIVGDAAALDVDSQANPMAVIAELLTDAMYGVGQSAARLDATSWQAVADALLARASDCYISVFMDKADTMRSVLALLLAYFDGWMRFSAGGTIEAGRFLHNEAPPAFTDATTIDFHDLVKEIEYDAQGWSETFNETIVKFQDGQRAFKDAGQMSNNGYNRRVTGEPKRATLDRPFITREAQAANHAVEWGKLQARPQLSGTLTVRKEKAVDIKPGDLFKLTHDALQLTIVCRCNEKSLSTPPIGQVSIGFSSERALAPLPYQPSAVPEGGTTLPEPEAIVNYQFVQPPQALAVSYDFPLFVLAAKSSDSTRGFRLWMKVADPDNFYELGEQRGFAVPGTLSADYDASATVDDDDSEALQLEIEDWVLDSELERITATQTEDAINDEALLVWLFKAGDPTQFEICTLKAIRLDSGVYKLKVKRGRFATEQLNFVVGDLAWIAYRVDMVVFFHRLFATYVPGGTAGDFRLQAFTAITDGDLTDTNQCPDVAFTFDDLHLPAVTWDKVQYLTGGAWADVVFGTWYGAATQFRVWATVRASSGLIHQVQVVAELGSAQFNMFTSHNHDTFIMGVSTHAFTFPEVGGWRLFAIVTEASGRVTKLEYPNTFMIGTGAVVASPTMSIMAGGYADGPSGVVTINCETGGATVYVAVENPDYTPTAAELVASAGGAAPYAFTWATTMKAYWLFDVFWNTGYRGRRSLWAFSRKGGMTDSALVRFDFWYQPE